MLQVPPIIPVTRGGANKGWEALLKALETAYFIAVDTEFSGIGDYKLLYGNSLEEKYEGLKQVISNRALFSVGLSVFGAKDASTAQNVLQHLRTNETSTDSETQIPKEFYVQTFDFLLLPNDDFVISPSSGSFLVQHGFDFARMFLDGIRYTRAKLNSSYQLLKEYQQSTKVQAPIVNKTTTEKDSKRKRKKQAEQEDLFLHLSESTWNQSENNRNQRLQSLLPLGLLTQLGKAGIPVIVHNGLLDLAFLYDAFEDSLPLTSEQFVKNLHQLLPCIYDTKVLSHSKKYADTSLDAVYGRCLKKKKKKTCIECIRAVDPSQLETAPVPSVFPISTNAAAVLEKQNGLSDVNTACQDKDNCSSGHALDKIANRFNWSSKTSSFLQSSHSAGYDAFCTGYIFATFLHSKKLSSLIKLKNCLYISKAKHLNLENNCHMTPSS
eukprot:jgi/Galph1/4443/GphlegSOOS_G3031.1